MEFDKVPAHAAAASRFTHLIPVGADRVLVIDAISHMRLVVDRAAARAIQSFAEPTEVAVLGPLARLLEGGISQRSRWMKNSPMSRICWGRFTGAIRAHFLSGSAAKRRKVPTPIGLPARPLA